MRIKEIYRGNTAPKDTDLMWIRGNEIFLFTNEGWTPVSGGGSSSAEDHLSETSESLIQNKAIYNQYVTEKDITDICSIIDPDYERKYYLDKPLTFEILTDGEIAWTASNNNEVIKTITYSINDGEEISITSVPGQSVTFEVVAGDVVKFKGTNSTYGAYGTISSNFQGTTCEFNVCGNIASLIKGEDFENVTESDFGSYTFFKLFYECKIVDAKNLILPNFTVEGIYGSMLSHWRAPSKLVSAPKLPAETLAYACYMSMFEKNTLLTKAPELPATTAANMCYSYMFSGCSSLNEVTCMLNSPTSTTNWLKDVYQQ